MTTQTHPLIAAALAAPKTHAVVTTWSDGHVDRHETRNEASANLYAVGERRNIGRELMRRRREGNEIVVHPKARVVSVEVVRI